MAYYRRNNYRRPSASMATSFGGGSGTCTLSQRQFVQSLISQIEAAQDAASDELLAVAEQTIGGLTVLPALLHDTEWQTVPMRDVSSVIDALKGLQRLFGNAKAANQYPFLPKHDRLMTTRFDGHCIKCHRGTIAGTDLAVQVAGRWQAWCISCATTDPAVADEQEAARKAALAALAGLHLFDRKVYRITDDGTIEVRRGRRWYEVQVDVPFSDITRVTAEVASAYADEHGECINCALPIGEGDDRRSIAVGYGPVCASRYGWYFPTHDEADAILERRRLARLAAAHS